MNLLSVAAVHATMGSDQGFGAKRAPEDPSTRPREFHSPSIITYEESMRSGMEPAVAKPLGEARLAD